MDEIFRNLLFVNTSFYIWYWNACNSHILQYQGLILKVCNPHPIKLIAAWLFPDGAIKGKWQNKIEGKLWPFNRFSELNFKTVIFQLAWFSWLFDASLVYRYVFWCATLGVHWYGCTSVHHFEFCHFWQFRRIDHNGSSKREDLCMPLEFALH